jgi:hypothetical protein
VIFVLVDGATSEAAGRLEAEIRRAGGETRRLAANLGGRSAIECRQALTPSALEIISRMPEVAFVLDTTGITGASVMPEPTGAVGLDMPAGAALSPPAPAPAAAGARNSATATALACSRAVTCWMNSCGLSAIWGAACRPTKTCWAAAAVSGTREDVSLPVRLQLCMAPTWAGGAPGFFGSETSTRPWSTCTFVV